MQNRRPEIFCLGANHKTAAIELRESLYLNEDQLLSTLAPIKSKFNFLELAAISTCNRFEMFGVLRHTEHLQDNAIAAFLEMQHIAHKSTPIDSEAIRQSTYLYHGRKAVLHLYAVASSLDSLVVGETQITGQFKNAIAIAKEAETLGSTLDRLAQDALFAAKKVRTQTAISEKTVSISHAALDLAKKVYGDIGDHSVAIVGTGEMGKVAAKYAAKYKPRHLYLVNRSLGSAERLVRELGMGEARALSEIGTVLERADIVISATGSPTPVITKEMVSRAFGARRGRNLVLVDIAVPRDIELSCSELDEAFVFDVDDLKQVVDDNIEQRQKAADEAQSIISTAADVFGRWLDSHSVKPAIKDFNAYLDTLFAKEGRRARSKQPLSQVTEDEWAAVEAMLASIKAKIAGDIARGVRTPSHTWSPENLAGALIHLTRGKPTDSNC